MLFFVFRSCKNTNLHFLQIIVWTKLNNNRNKIIMKQPTLSNKHIIALNRLNINAGGSFDRNEKPSDR